MEQTGQQSNRRIQHRCRTSGQGRKTAVPFDFLRGSSWRCGHAGRGMLFPRQLISIFGAANESVHYTEFAVRSFRIYLCTMTLACINKAAFIYLQSLGKAFASTMLSMVREVVFGVGFALLLAHFFAIDGVLYSMPAADILTSILSCVCLYKAVKLLRSPREKVIRQNG